MVSLEEEVLEVPEEVVDYCEEVYYDIQMEAEGFCDGDDCIDPDCYSDCVKRLMGEGDA